MQSEMTATPVLLADLQLARKALCDRKSEEMVLQKVYPRIASIARMVAGNRSQADDIVQIAAIEVMKSLKTFKGQGSLEAWAGRIAYRTAVKNVIKNKKPESMTMPLFDQDIRVEETPERSVSRRRLFDSLLDSLTVIPEKRRVPLLLHLAYGHTVAEVAELTNVSQNTVKDRLKTAFREFQAILKEHPNLKVAMLEELR